MDIFDHLSLKNKFVKRFILSLIAFCLPIYALAEQCTLGYLDSIGGEFSVEDQSGEIISTADFKDEKALWVYFGYSSCPDVCLLTMTDVKQEYKKLSRAHKNKVQLLFISIDPQVDTPARLKSYLSIFNPKFKGLSTDDKTVKSLAKKFRISFRKINSAGGHGHHANHDHDKKHENHSEQAGPVVNHYIHTDMVFLVDTDTRTRELYHGSDLTDVLARDTKKLLRDC